MSEILSNDESGLMLAPLVGVEPIKPSPDVTDTRLTVNDAAKRDVSSAIIGIVNGYKYQQNINKWKKLKKDW